MNYALPRSNIVDSCFICDDKFMHSMSICKEHVKERMKLQKSNRDKGAMKKCLSRLCKTYFKLDKEPSKYHVLHNSKNSSLCESEKCKEIICFLCKDNEYLILRTFYCTGLIRHVQDYYDEEQDYEITLNEKLMACNKELSPITVKSFACALCFRKRFPATKFKHVYDKGPFVFRPLDEKDKNVFDAMALQRTMQQLEQAINETELKAFSPLLGNTYDYKCLKYFYGAERVYIIKDKNSVLDGYNFKIKKDVLRSWDYERTKRQNAVSIIPLTHKQNYTCFYKNVYLPLGKQRQNT